MLSPGQIVSLYHERVQSYGASFTRMREIRDAYNGDVFVPLPSRVARSSVPNLVAQGLDQSAMRVSSVLYDLRFYPDRPGFKVHEENARKRRLATFGWLEQNNVALKQRRRARWLLGYGCAPVLIRPSYSSPIPRWQIRDPLSTYPARTDDPDDIVPPDCIFATQRTGRYLLQHYPVQFTSLRRGKSDSPDTRYMTLEYVDAEQITCVLLSSLPLDTHGEVPVVNPAFYDNSPLGHAPYTVLEDIPNRIGICPAVVPGRITLDRDAGAYDGIVGMYQTMAMLFALETEAVAQGVWPDQWLIARPNENAEIITVADGRAGIIGKVTGGQIETVVNSPGYMTTQTIDRLERYQRTTAGIPPEYGGESGSNIRTGRRGQDILSAAVDFPIQEAQALFERSAEEEVKRAIATQRAYYGDMPQSYYVSWSGASGQVDYTPNILFTSDRVTAKFAYPGTDINNLTIITGQKLGLGTMSKRTAMEIDPQIDDVEVELDRITGEGLQQALLTSIEQQAVQGAITPPDLARIIELVTTNKMELPDAVQQAQQEAQERQSATVNPAAPGSPPTQPGIAQPGMGAEAGAIPPPPAGLEGLRATLSALRPASAAIRQGAQPV
jgi:hypothetical protein